MKTQAPAPAVTGWHYPGNTIPRQLTQSIALEESHVPGALSTSVNIIGIMLGLFLVWAAFTRVQEVAVAQGQIVPSSYVQNIQHLEGGIVREILVEDGEIVEKGQPLIRLDDTNANADLGQMKARQKSLRLQAARLRNFAASEGSMDNLDASEREILASMEAARTSQQNVLKDQLNQKEKELQGVLATRGALEKNLALAREEHKINRALSKRGSVSKMAVMMSERQVNELQGQVAMSVSQENQVRAALDEMRNRLASLGADLKQDAMKNLGQVEAELAELDKGIAKLESASARTVLDAPVRGVVKGLNVHTLGAVVEQGKTLLEIIPLEGDLMAEALIAPNDIGNVREGQEVTVKVTAYDYSRFGSIKGRLETVSASTFQDEEGKSFYKTKIRLDKNHVGKNPAMNTVMPGMIVQADIITGNKTVLDYLLKPIHKATQTAFRER